jgi:hypothetical protein
MMEVRVRKKMKTKTTTILRSNQGLTKLLVILNPLHEGNILAEGVLGWVIALQVK